jgi:hypothetical protein
MAMIGMHHISQALESNKQTGSPATFIYAASCLVSDRISPLFFQVTRFDFVRSFPPDIFALSTTPSAVQLRLSVAAVKPYSNLFKT